MAHVRAPFYFINLWLITYRHRYCTYLYYYSPPDHLLPFLLLTLLFIMTLLPLHFFFETIALPGTLSIAAPIKLCLASSCPHFSYLSLALSRSRSLSLTPSLAFLLSFSLSLPPRPPPLCLPLSSSPPSPSPSLFLSLDRLSLSFSLSLSLSLSLSPCLSRSLSLSCAPSRL